MNNSALTGAWKPEMYAAHLPEEIAFDESLLKFTLQVCQPKHALDIGCGLGYFVKYLRDKGVDAWGIEGYDLGSLFKAPGYQIKQDITQPFDLKEKYDLVMCLEVVEHIPREFEDIVFDNIVRHMGKYLLFSSAPRQQGTEGMDEIILESINYEASSPTVICVETITFSKTGTGVKNTSIVKFLESKGYMVFADTYINTIFVKLDRWVRS